MAPRAKRAAPRELAVVFAQMGPVGADRRRQGASRR